jgi:site-specific DNA recombinase
MTDDQRSDQVGPGVSSRMRLPPSGNQRQDDFLSSSVSPSSHRERSDLMRRAFIYLRVSTKGQAETDYDAEGYSIPAQRDACKRRATELGAAVVGEYLDRGESAKSADRPELIRMLDDLVAGEVDYVIVHKLDRLARSRSDDVAIALAIQQAGARLVSVSENVDGSPSGKLMHGIMATIAEFYSANLGHEAKKGMRQKAKNGGTPGRAAIGYINVRELIDGREIRTVAVDRDRADHVRWAFQAYATGEWTVRTITDELDQRGLRGRGTRTRAGRPLSTGSVHEMLRNPYYVGLVTFDGVQYKGRHEPLIDLPTWQDVQQVLEGRRLSQERPARRVHHLKGLLACGLCGSNLGISHSRGKQGNVYPYFYCLRRQRHHDCELPWIPVAKAEQTVERFWSKLPTNPEWLETVRSSVGEHIALAKDLNRDEVTRQRARLEELERQANKLLQAHYADAISLEQLKAEQTRITNERAHAERILTRCTEQYDQLSLHLDDALAKLESPAQAFRESGPRGQRELVSSVFTKLYLTPEGIGGSDLADLYQVLLADDLDERLIREREAISEGTIEELIDTPTVTDAEIEALLNDALTPSRYERPYGLLPWETKNPDNEACRGSNVTALVGAEGLEPPTPSL